MELNVTLQGTPDAPTETLRLRRRYYFPAGTSSNAPGDPAVGLVLARDGMMYGAKLFGSVEQTFGLDSGIVHRFDPAKGTFKGLADFNGTVGACRMRP